MNREFGISVQNYFFPSVDVFQTLVSSVVYPFKLWMQLTTCPSEDTVSNTELLTVKESDNMTWDKFTLQQSVKALRGVEF
jgi:hypothetical protein